jgi:hypothetical protein
MTEVCLSHACDGTWLTINQCPVALKTARLEITYEQMLGRLNELYDRESIRLLRVDRDLLEVDNDFLHMQFEHTDRERARVSETEFNMRQQLADACNETAQLQSTLRSNSRQIDDLKVKAPFSLSISV